MHSRNLLKFMLLLAWQFAPFLHASENTSNSGTCNSGFTVTSIGTCIPPDLSDMSAATLSTMPAELLSVALHNPANPAEKSSFGELIKGTPVVAVFLRRFGCQMCRVHAQDLEVIRPDVEKAGAKLVCIGHENFGEGSDKDRSWSAGNYYKGAIWTDADKTIFKALYGRKTIWSGFGLFDMSSERISQIRERSVPGNFQGDGFQLGGTFVIDTDGSVLLDHRAKYYGDDATNEVILQSLTRSKALTPEGKATLTAAVAKAKGTPSAAESPVCTTEACSA
jgi:hypothetical protein